MSIVLSLHVPPHPPPLPVLSSPYLKFHFLPTFTLKNTFSSCETTCSYNGSIENLKACTLYTFCPRGLNDQARNVMGRFRQKGGKVNKKMEFNFKIYK